MPEPGRDPYSTRPLLRTPGPLVRRAPVRLLRSGAGGALLAGAFALFAVAAAAPPLFTESAGNAALAAQLRTVPETASADASPVVRIVSGRTGRADDTRTLDRIPGLGPAVATAASIGLELHPLEGSVTDVTGPAGTAPARLFGQARPASELVSVDRAASRRGLWLPQPVARAIGVGPGDAVRLGYGTARGRKEAPTTVAGVYAVGPDGRVPADPRGTRVWTERRGVLPADAHFGTRAAYLLVGDLPTVTALARAVGDDLLVAVEARLDPRVPTLADAKVTAAEVQQQVVLARDRPGSAAPGPVRYQIVSGVPTLVDDAAQVTDRTVAWTSSLGAAGVVLGLVTVLAAAQFGVRRRAVELRHSVGAGLRPVALGALATAETLPMAVICGGLGLLGAWAVVVGVGPGPVTTASSSDAAVRAAGSAAAGVLVMGVVMTVAAAREARLAADRPSRTMPWEAGLAAVAVAAAAGLWTRPAGGPPGAFDLLVPALVLAAAGAVGGRLLPGVVGRLAPARPVPALAVRRLAAGGAVTALVVAALTTGLGLLGYSLAAASSVRTVTDDRVATRAGAAATAGVGAPSWQLDPGAPQLPPPVADPLPLPDLRPVAGARVPPLPRTETVVWRGRVTVPPDFGNVDVLVVDPARFAAVASWGGGALRHARELTTDLVPKDAANVRALRAGYVSRPVPAIGVGDVLQRAEDRAAISLGESGASDVRFRVLDVVPAYPGYGGDLPMVVVPANSFFLRLGELDPRVRPSDQGSPFTRARAVFAPELWSARGETGLRAVLGPRGLKPQNTRTLAQFRQDPDVVGARSAIGFQVAFGICLAAIGTLVLALFADRAAARARPADLLLARMGLGTRGVLRARSVELAALASLALALAAIGIAVLVPLGARLLDPGGGVAPPFTLRPDARAVLAAIGAAVLGLVLAITAARVRGAAGSAEEVLRDAD